MSAIMPFPDFDRTLAFYEQEGFAVTALRGISWRVFSWITSSFDSHVEFAAVKQNAGTVTLEPTKSSG